MSDWNKQVEETMKSWTKAQQQLWENWKSAMPKTGSTQATEAWDQAFSFWKDAVDKSLNAQVEWASMWANSVKSATGAPKEWTAWTDQVVATMKTWNESQTQLWNSMFESMKQATPDTLTQRMDEGAQLVFQTWQDAIHRAVEAQKELTKYWAVGNAKEK